MPDKPSLELVVSTVARVDFEKFSNLQYDILKCAMWNLEVCNVEFGSVQF